jgi:hypothetical protein
MRVVKRLMTALAQGNRIGHGSFHVCHVMTPMAISAGRDVALILQLKMAWIVKLQGSMAVLAVLRDLGAKLVSILCRIWLVWV